MEQVRKFFLNAITYAEALNPFKFILGMTPRGGPIALASDDPT